MKQHVAVAADFTAISSFMTMKEHVAVVADITAITSLQNAVVTNIRHFTQ